jgi:hypothetical protein
MRKCLVLAALSLMLLLELAYAQPQSAIPLVISAKSSVNYGTDLYAYRDAQWQRLTKTGCTYGLKMSPSGAQVAFLTAPSFSCGEDAREQGYGYLLGAAWNIEILDLSTGERREIAGQPAGVALPDVHGAVQRSEPAWSPDGTALAWTEQDYPTSNVARLMTSNLLTGVTQTLDAALPLMTMSETGLPVFLTWGEPGIVVFTNGPMNGAETLRVYNPVNGELHNVRLPEDVVENWYPQAEMIWVSDQTGELLLIQAETPVWYIVDVDDQVIDGLGNYLVQSSVNTASNSMQVIWNPYAFGDQVLWRLVDSTGDEVFSWVRAPENTTSNLLVAPTGDSAVYQVGNSLTFWREGTPTELDLPEDLILRDVGWGVQHWQFGAELHGIG